MAYVRRKGRQVAIVHGVRDSETQKVEQRTLFTLYSKAEAQAAVGEHRVWFRQLLEEQHPRVRFDWAKVDDGIREQMDHLPDLYGYKKDRVDLAFRSALVGFARELMLADPQDLGSAARVLQEHEHELVYLRELIDWRLRLCEQEDDEWSRDNPFYWRTLSHRRRVPHETHERLAALYEERDYDAAGALAQLLVECWPDFCEGHSYLGLIALDEGDPEGAAEHFDEAIRVGRACLPKRVPRDAWWSDHDTRPYLRALAYKARALDRLGDHVGALRLCERLEHDHDQDLMAADARLPILLNAGQWEDAAAAAGYLHRIYPHVHIPRAIALFELGRRDEALVSFLRGATRFPLTARMLVGAEEEAPHDYDSARDHDQGVDLMRDLSGYFLCVRPDFDAFFGSIVASAHYRALAVEYAQAKQEWSSTRRADQQRPLFDEVKEMETEEWASAAAAVVRAELEA